MDVCLLHANCQGEPLARLLAASPEFAARWRIRHIVNYTHEPVPPETLADCSLFLYQHLGPQWDTLASAYLLDRLPAAATALCIPNLFFKGYWPLWTSASTMNFGDIYLDHLVDLGLDLPEIMHLYLRDDLSPMYDLDSIVAESQNLERSREQGSILPLVDYVEEHWRQTQLFTTVNHPAPALVHKIADAILAALGLPGIPPAVLPGLDLACDSSFELPIHPAVARHFQLPFAGETRTYPVYGKHLTFRQYALCYADCRRRRLNLLEYLMGVEL